MGSIREVGVNLRQCVRASKGASWILFANFLVAGIAEANVNQTTTKDGKTVYEFAVEGIETQKQVGGWGTTFSVVTLKGVPGYDAVIYQVGEPMIPAIRFFVHSNEPITVLPGSDLVDLPKLESQVFPTQMSMAKNHQGPVPFSFNAEAYEEDEYTPNKAFEITDAGTVRGVKRQLVTLYPYYYRPSSGEQRLRKTFKVIAKKVVSPALKPSNKETIVFVVGEKFKDSPALKTYIEFKQKLGFFTYLEVVTAEANNTPDKIRARLKAFYSSKAHDLRYVILVGDNEDVPGHAAKFLSGASPWSNDDDDRLPTDHYYRSLDTDDYVTDINGPDVGVGRFSVSSEKELEVVTQKYMRYQTASFKDDKWLKRATFLATNDETYFEVAEGSHDFVTESITSKLGYMGRFPVDPAKGGDRLYAIRHDADTEHILTALNEGRGIVNYSGHGDLDRWDSPNFAIADLNKIENKDALPFVISNACITGQFSIPLSFAEAWQRHPQGGVFFWGSVDNTYWYEDDHLERKLYDLIAKADALDFASLTNNSIADVYRYYGGEGRSAYYWETYTSFGDPSVEFRSEPVRKPVLYAPTYIPRYSKGLGVTLLDASGAAVKNARLTLRLPNGEHRNLATDAKGYAMFDFDPAALNAKGPIAVYGSGANLAYQEFLLPVAH